MSRVDVIVPCYKYAHFLRECVESIQSQSLTDVRVLIIDDASPDHTPEVAAELAARDKRVEYRRHSVNHGHIATYNEGLEWATGDYTLLLSADDLLTPGALRRAVRLMDSHPELGLVYGRSIVFKTGESLPQPRTVSEVCEWQIWDGIDWLKAMCKGDRDKNCIRSPEVIVRTRLQRELGGYREELPHVGDQEMWMRFAVHAEVGILDADQAFYRVHDHNMHQMYKRLHGVEQSKVFFDTLLHHCEHRIAGRERLQDLAAVAIVYYPPRIANYALSEAYSAFCESDVQGCRELIDYAIRSCPNSRTWKLYRRLIWMLRMGPTAWFGLSRTWKLYRRLIWTLRMGPTAWFGLRQLAYWRSYRSSQETTGTAKG